MLFTKNWTQHEGKVSSPPHSICLRVVYGGIEIEELLVPINCIILITTIVGSEVQNQSLDFLLVNQNVNRLPEQGSCLAARHPVPVPDVNISDGCSLDNPPRHELSILNIREWYSVHRQLLRCDKVWRIYGTKERSGKMQRVLCRVFDHINCIEESPVITHAHYRTMLRGSSSGPKETSAAHDREFGIEQFLD